MTDNRFRYDINGLRAIAVIMVVFFHFHIPVISSGFSGVDVFFVISGYLMTKIIVERVCCQSFSLFYFFMARACRILPALLVLCASVYILGFFFLIPEDFSYFSLFAFRSIFFLSNYYLMKETEGYFAPSSHDNLLLHTWSLSVEWQFYIFLPIFILCIHKAFKGKYIKQSLLILFVFSFLFSVLLRDNSLYAYYLFPSRAWEMIIGGLVFCYATEKDEKKNHNLLFWLGVSLILLSAVLFSEDSIWPSSFTLVPTIGTAIVIFCNRKGSFLERSKTFQLIGSASYSIYLWHWPIYVLFHYWQLSGVAYSIFAIILSFFIGFLSYRFVEIPSKRILSADGKLVALAILIFPIVVFSVIFRLTVTHEGYPGRAKSEHFVSISKKMQLPLPSNGWCFYSIDNIKELKIGNEGLQCHIGSKKDGAKRILLFGDSFAGQYIPFWDILGKKENYDINAITTNWCYPSSDDQFNGRLSSRAYKQCLINRKFLIENYMNYDFIILSGDWKNVLLDEKYKNGFVDVLNLIISHGKKVIVMAEPYSFNVDVGKAYKRALWVGQDFNIDDYKGGAAQLMQLHADRIMSSILTKHENLLYLSRNDLFNKSQYAYDKVPYSWDGKHISVIGSIYSEKYFEKNNGIVKLNNFVSGSLLP